MEDDKNSQRRIERRKSVKISNEHRYESLQSLGRLVENDFKTEEEISRRVSLPTLNDNFLSQELTTGVWRRNSSVVDYMQELASKRREMIQRLIPDIESKEKSVCETVLNHGEHNKNGDYRSAGVNDSKAPDLDCLSNSCKESDQMETDINDEEDTIKIIRERIEKFESMKNIPRSINADDFQQFLGARYLEIYQKRARRSNLVKGSNESNMNEVNSAQESTDQNNGMKESSQGRQSRSLNAKIHSIARQNQSRVGNSYFYGQNLKVTLPPIVKDNEIDRKDLANKKRAVFEINAKYQHGFAPIRNDLTVEGSERSHTKGIPCHTANRANKRYHESREINSILNELRRLSSTVQKSEQEIFVHKLEEDN